jgi:hypothetical protein
MTRQDNNMSEQLEQLEQKLSDDIYTIKHEVDDLYKTVYKGNGMPSLMTRVSGVEGKLRGLREQMDEKINHLSKESSLRFDSLHQKLESKFGRLEGWIEVRTSSIEKLMKEENNKSRIDQAGGWQLKVAMITAITAIILALVTNYLN